MSQNIQNLALVLLKISSRIRRRTLREKIESVIYSLLENGALNDFENLSYNLTLLKTFVSFGVMIYEVEPINGKLVSDYLDNLQVEIRQKGVLPNEREIGNLLRQLPDNTSVIRQSEPVSTSMESANNFNNSATNQASDKIASEYNNFHANNNNGENGNGDNNGIAGLIRQQAILEKIKQSGNREIRLKDVLAEFPDVSERTLRYDLQRLCQQGALERIGNGGPGTYYVIKSQI